MQSFNHVAGGFAFTGLLASFADLNIFERFDTMAVVWVAAVLPDVDHTKSLIGKTCYPLAKWLQTNYGHRTVTHSLWFFLAVVFVIRVTDAIFHLYYTLPVALSLGSHLIFDMCTKQGIPVFYPFSKRPAVLPANPKLRLSAGDFRSEAILFVLFCCLNVFSYPLMAQGFWARYNRGFATFDHLESEMRRKPGTYGIEIVRPEGDTVIGPMVELKPSQVVIWQNSRFVVLERSQVKLLNFLRSRTQRQTRTVNLFQISPDSLNVWLTKPVVHVEAQSTQDLYYFDGPLMKQGKQLTIDYPNGARFRQIAVDNRETEAQLQLLEGGYKEEQRQYARKMGEFSELKAELSHELTRKAMNDYDEGERRQRVIVLTEKVAQFVQPDPPNEETYQVHRDLLEMKLRENQHLNATLLVWEVKKHRN